MSPAGAQEFYAGCRRDERIVHSHMLPLPFNTGSKMPWASCVQFGLEYVGIQPIKPCKGLSRFNTVEDMSPSRYLELFNSEMSHAAIIAAPRPTPT